MRKRIGVLLQGNGLLTDLTVAENVALPLRTHTELPDAVIRRLVEMKLHAVGLRAAATCSRASSPAAWRAASRWPARWRWIRR
jgi:ABC-type transporter Mla maintaining outer membrane lipid asymmetry ATPase subunit MlaF